MRKALIGQVICHAGVVGYEAVAAVGYVRKHCSVTYLSLATMALILRNWSPGRAGCPGGAGDSRMCSGWTGKQRQSFARTGIESVMDTADWL